MSEQIPADADPAPKSDPTEALGAGSAKTRSALKKVGSRAKSAADPAAAQTRRRQRSAQAALGMMDKPAAAQDEAALKEWLASLPQPQKEKLARLIGQAQQTSAPSPPPKGGLAKIERQLAEQGFHFDINANTVIVNIGSNGRDNPGRDTWRGRTTNGRGDWGRQWGRVKDFINGH